MSRFALLVFLLLLLVANPAGAASPDVVVSQVFGGGGNSGSPLQNDFVELFNRGSTSVDVTGWTVQYATASSSTWQRTTLSGTIVPGGYYLVQEASSAAVGSTLPTPDVTGSINLSASSGKVAVVRGSTSLSCGASAGSCASDASIADLVGYGSAADYEGSGAAPGLSSTNAAVRAGEGCTDTDSNASDFSASSPSPRNSASATITCSGSPTPPPPPPPPPPAPPAGPVANATVSADVASTLTISLSRASLDFGRLAFGSSVSPIAEDVTVTSNDPSGYVLSVHRTAFTPDDLPLAASAHAPAGATLNAAFAGGAKVAVPVAPALDLLIGSSSALSGADGDVWPVDVGFLEPIPLVSAGAHTATLTFTVVGR
jgi:hypothetical protein